MRRIALTGTPGTGKTSVARLVDHGWAIEEVADVARRAGAARVRGAGVEVDLDRLVRGLRASPRDRADIVVGHLSHLLPIRDVIVLRCHPRELRDRLARGRPRQANDTRENLLAEATDVILFEALDLRRRVWEIDTTGHRPAEVAEAVAQRVRRRGPPSYGRIDWLSDPWVTEHLLDWSR